MRDRSRELIMIQETLQILEQGYYVKNGKKIQLKLSRREMEEIHVYLPDDVKDCGSREDFDPPYVMGRCGYGCENKDSFSLARERVTQTYLYDKDIPKILVLNLANAIHPGGGVRRGAKAQEEDLCRCSSLLLSLESKEARRYYDYNESLHTKMGSDALMITPKVEIIRDENGELLADTVIVSVVTCAAPLVSYGKEGMTDAQYEQMMYDRIMGMLKCVAYLGYRKLILGAWGCGAFGNDAAVMSDLFYKALKEIDYNGHGQKDLFRRIDFAVLDLTRDQYNFREFRRNFTHENFYRDERQRAIDEAMERKKETEDDGRFVFFWKLHHKNEEFSNWYPKEFVIEGIRYNCVEQYMMAKKAILFGDITVYQQIMNETDPGKCKDLGKLVRNFDSAIWDSCKREIVFNANYAKFTQNPDLMAKLKATRNAIMAEASPGDKIWGIGMTADDPDARNPERWKGQNILGDILMELRQNC